MYCIYEQKQDSRDTKNQTFRVCLECKLAAPFPYLEGRQLVCAKALDGQFLDTRNHQAVEKEYEGERRKEQVGRLRLQSGTILFKNAQADHAVLLVTNDDTTMT